MTRAIASCLCGALSVALSAGCASSYVPKTSGRIAVVQRGGVPSYMRDGRVYEGGIFGGDLDEAVRGNPQAEAYARSFSSGMAAGFVTNLLGVAVGLAGVGTAYAGAHPRDGGDPNMSTQTLGWGMATGGAVAYIVGLALMLNAQPHMWDAINAYNDGVPEVGPALRPAQSGGGAKPTSPSSAPTPAVDAPVSEAKPAN